MVQLAQRFAHSCCAPSKGSHAEWKFERQKRGPQNYLSDSQIFDLHGYSFALERDVWKSFSIHAVLHDIMPDCLKDDDNLQERLLIVLSLGG